MINGLLCTRISENLNNKIQSGKIQRIYQLNEFELLIKIRANRTNFQLINNINANALKLYLSNDNHTTQENATNFTMVLRKQIEGAFINKIYQHQCDRIIVFELLKHNELRESETKYLVFELVGRQANTILCDQNFVIIDLLKKVPLLLSDNNHRLLNKNLVLEFLPNHKENPLIDFKEVDNYFETYQGFDKHLNEVFINSDNPKVLLEEYLSSNKVYLYDNLISFIPYNKKLVNEFDDLDETFDYHFKNQSQKSNEITFKKEIKALKNLIKKNDKKIKKLEEQYQENLNFEEYQKLGKLLYDNIYQFNKNQHYDNVEVFDFETNENLKIELDARFNYGSNAQKFLNKYQKLKKSFVYLEDQIKKAKKENEYLQGIIDSTPYLNNNDMNEIIEELINKKFILRSLKIPKKNKKSKPKFETFVSEDGTKVLVGKNDLQNNYITFTLADKEDTWLHIANQSGAHVIIKDHDPSDEVLELAAGLATYFSNTQDQVKYDVEYTKVKHLRKDKALGKVLFKTYNTLSIVNDINIIDRLKRTSSY